MDIEKGLDWLARTQIAREDVAGECAHPATEVRCRRVRNGAIQYVPQCLSCGESAGNPIAHCKIAGTPPPFDEGLSARIRADRSRAHEIARQEWWADYTAYLQSPEWKAKSRKVLERENFVCQGCGGKATQAHHLTYAHVFAEFLFELLALCEACHDRIHGQDLDGGRSQPETPNAENKY